MEWEEQRVPTRIMMLKQKDHSLDPDVEFGRTQSNP